MSRPKSDYQRGAEFERMLIFAQLRTQQVELYELAANDSELDATRFDARRRAETLERLLKTVRAREPGEL